MPRIPTIAPDRASEPAKRLLDDVQAKLGTTPNLMKTMAQSPATLEGYLQFSGALGGGVLDPQTREQIALTVGQANRCGYCLSAHTAIGKVVGLSEAQIHQARGGRADTPKTQAVLTLAAQVVEHHGQVSDAQLDEARGAGLSDGEITETVANVALNLLTNYLNHVAQTQIDFPEVDPALPGDASSAA